MESPRRDLLNDMAERKSILKNNQSRRYRRFSFTHKTAEAFPKTGVCLCCVPGNTEQQDHLLLKQVNVLQR